MTDLKKGIIEIDGFQIGPDTTPKDIETNLKDRFAFHATSKDGNSDIFRFENVPLLNRCFKVKTTFIHQKIREIKLISYNKEKLSYKECFNTDCKWLKGILGEPDEAGSNGVIYHLDSVQVGAINFECDGRSGSDEFVHINYSRGSQL